MFALHDESLVAELWPLTAIRSMHGARSNLVPGSGGHVYAWSKWRGGGPPMGRSGDGAEHLSSRLALLQDRLALAQAKLRRTEVRVTLRRTELEHATKKYNQAHATWEEKKMAELACTLFGPKKRDLKDATERAYAKRQWARGSMKRLEKEYDELTDWTTYLDRKCVKAVQIGLTAAEWAHAVLATGASASAADGGPRGALCLLEDVDDTGVPVGLGLVLATAKLDSGASQGTPQRSTCWSKYEKVDPLSDRRTLSALSVVLALAGVCHAYRDAVRTWVGVQLRGLDFAALAQREEFPRIENKISGQFQPLHYDESVLSYCEPRGDGDGRRIAASHQSSLARIAELEAKVEKPDMVLGDIPLHAFPTNAFDATQFAPELTHDELYAWMVSYKTRQDSYMASNREQWRKDIVAERRKATGIEASVRAHATKRAVVALPLALRALAACHPHTARALPLRWPLRLLSALAKVALRRPRAPIDEVARAFVAVVAPGATKTQEGVCQYVSPGCSKIPEQKLREVRKASDDGYSVANVHRVTRLLLRYSTGHGWSVAEESQFLKGDVDIESMTIRWQADDPSVVLAANLVGRLPDKHGLRRERTERGWNKDEEDCVFEDEVDAVRATPPFWRSRLQLPCHTSWHPRWERTPRAPVPLPRALSCPVKTTNQTQLATVGTSSGGGSGTQWHVIKPALGDSPEDPAVTSEKAARKRRKLTDDRNAFRRLFQTGD